MIWVNERCFSSSRTNVTPKLHTGDHATRPSQGVNTGSPLYRISRNMLLAPTRRKFSGRSPMRLLWKPHRSTSALDLGLQMRAAL
ncbi:hypothetical protein MRX96_041853 [Rhipicephalus microplus]